MDQRHALPNDAHVVDKLPDRRPTQRERQTFLQLPLTTDLTALHPLDLAAEIRNFFRVTACGKHHRCPEQHPPPSPTHGVVFTFAFPVIVTTLGMTMPLICSFRQSRKSELV